MKEYWTSLASLLGVLAFCQGILQTVFPPELRFAFLKLFNKIFHWFLLLLLLRHHGDRRRQHQRALQRRPALPELHRLHLRQPPQPDTCPQLQRHHFWAL
ncbi:AAA-ATPase [Prunus yedoensis var. nudiflora]|uniref:AAA-ATPase n=1 Tax=Prunus yedoensis var. nudiflora TaxID=2094558 RepID=A0A314YBR2_PRUYE|nr:AAA-ATPase [Prunus yedoensis var. nudiflora]